MASIGFPALQRWDAAPLLGVGVFLLVARVPMAIQLLGALSLVVLMLQGMVWRRGFGWFGAFFIAGLVTSAVATVSSPSGFLNGYFVMMLAFALLAGATWFSGDVWRNLRVLMTAVFVGLWFHFALSMIELFSGIKILAIRAPGASTVPTVLADPWVVTSLFVNYNDYSVAMVIFIDLLIASLAFSRGTARWAVVAQCLALALVTVVVIMIGSRGAFVALAFSGLILALLLLRFTRPSLLPRRRMWLIFGLGGLAFAVLWNSPYFQNHSTAWRAQIISQVLAMLASNPSRLLIGYGSEGAFGAAAAAAYPGQLMNPHNLVVELVVAYGIVAMLLFVAALVVVMVRGIIRLEVPMNAPGLAAVATGVSLVVYGSVPSAYLAYGYPYLFLITAGAALWLKREG